MALEFKNSVKDQTITEGTGDITILGTSIAGFQTIVSAHADGATLHYRIQNEDNTQWEINTGVWNSGTGVLTRGTVVNSSNSNSLVSFGAGVKTVITTMLASDIVLGGISSSQLASAISDETGSGSAVFGTAPLLSVPALLGTTEQSLIVNRETTAATAGKGLTVQAGGAVSSGTNLAGGITVISSGISTGTGTSSIQFKTATAGSTGTSDNAPTTKMTVLGNGNVGIGVTPTESLDISGNLNLPATGIIKFGTTSIMRVKPSLGNVAVGEVAGNIGSATGTNNFSAATFSLFSISTGLSNCSIGYGSFLGLTTGSYNVAYGYSAGRFISDGVVLTTGCTYSTYIGAETKSLSNSTTTNENVFGYASVGLGSNSVVIGNESVVSTALKGKVGIATGTATPSNNLSFGGNTARTIGLERHTTANTAGNSLTINAGGATSAATDKSGGQLVIKGGISTGTGSSGVTLQGFVAGSTGTTDATPQDMLKIVGNALGLYNNAVATQPTCAVSPLTTITHTDPGTPDYALQDLTQTVPWGFATQDEGNTLLKVVAALQAEIADLKTALRTNGTLA